MLIANRTVDQHVGLCAAGLGNSARNKQKVSYAATLSVGSLAVWQVEGSRAIKAARVRSPHLHYEHDRETMNKQRHTTSTQLS